jgi:hypothetical protein
MTVVVKNFFSYPTVLFPVSVVDFLFMVLKVFVATHLMARYAFAVCVQVVWNQGVTVYAGVEACLPLVP